MYIIESVIDYMCTYIVHVQIEHATKKTKNVTMF